MLGICGGKLLIAYLFLILKSIRDLLLWWGITYHIDKGEFWEVFLANYNLPFILIIVIPEIGNW